MNLVVCGNVDDGKSTLIGRLLYDTDSLFNDQLEDLQKISETRKNTEDNSELNFALITDGLKSEREQGITIDVAYRFFSTPKRSFCIIDVPGHIQYLRNMFTGASQADIGLLLIDISKGINEQTKRHLTILTLVKVKHIFILINKMDLVGFEEDQYKKIVFDLEKLLKIYEWKDYHFIPISSLKGEGIISSSGKMKWFHGESLLGKLESFPVIDKKDEMDLGYIQGTIRTSGDFRAYMPHYSNHSLESGEKIFIHSPDEENAKIIHLKEANDYWFSTQGDHDLPRGTIFSKVPLTYHEQINAHLCWFHNAPPDQGNYIIAHCGSKITCMIDEIYGKLNIDNFQIESMTSLYNQNDILHVRLKMSSPHVFDKYDQNRMLGCFLLIDPKTNITVAAGIIKS